MKVSVLLDDDAVVALDQAAKAAGASRVEVIRAVLGEWLLTSGKSAPISRVDELRADFDKLGRLIDEAEGSAAAALARERRLIGEQLEALENSTEVTSVVDQLAERRNRSATAGSPSRRRKPG